MGSHQLQLLFDNEQDEELQPVVDDFLSHILILISENHISVWPQPTFMSLHTRTMRCPFHRSSSDFASPCTPFLDILLYLDPKHIYGIRVRQRMACRLCSFQANI